MTAIAHGTRRRTLGPALRRGGWAAWEWLARPVHYRSVHRLHTAAEAGDTERLRSLLAPTVAVVVDSGSGDPSGVRVIQGVANAAVVLEHGFARVDGVLVDARSVNSQAGLIISRAGRPIASVAVDFTGHLVSMVWVPDKLRSWSSGSATERL
jgi:RNA polymerase sigma-70 factor (ECF subfamily)